MHNINLTVKIERAISELRRGGKVVISDNNTGISVLLMSSELVQLDTVDTFSKIALSRPNIILSANRSKAIGIKSDKLQFLLIRIEHGLLSDFIPIALQRLADKIILGRESAIFENVSTVSNCTNSEDISKTEIPVLIPEITTLPPLLASDIALSIFTVKFILCIICV